MTNIILKDSKDLKSDFLIYSSDFCPYCVAAERFLKAKGMTFTIIDLTNNPQKRREIVNETNHRTVPVIFDLRKEKPVFIGGFDDLQASGLF